jgi:hypothetical protein
MRLCLLAASIKKNLPVMLHAFKKGIYIKTRPVFLKGLLLHCGIDSVSVCVIRLNAKELSILL